MIASQVKSFLVVVVHLRRLDQARSNDLRKIWALKLKRRKTIRFLARVLDSFNRQNKTSFLNSQISKTTYFTCIETLCTCFLTFARVFKTARAIKLFVQDMKPHICLWTCFWLANNTLHQQGDWHYENRTTSLLVTSLAKVSQV